jgi:hypothetical protein
LAAGNAEGVMKQRAMDDGRHESGSLLPLFLLSRLAPHNHLIITQMRIWLNDLRDPKASAKSIQNAIDLELRDKPVNPSFDGFSLGDRDLNKRANPPQSFLMTLLMLKSRISGGFSFLRPSATRVFWRYKQ